MQAFLYKVFLRGRTHRPGSNTVSSTDAPRSPTHCLLQQESRCRTEMLLLPSRMMLVPKSRHTMLLPKSRHTMLLPGAPALAATTGPLINDVVASQSMKFVAFSSATVSLTPVKSERSASRSLHLVCSISSVQRLSRFNLAIPTSHFSLSTAVYLRISRCILQARSGMPPSWQLVLISDGIAWVGYKAFLSVLRGPASPGGNLIRPSRPHST